MRIEGIYNVMEGLVWKEMLKVLGEYPEACKCQECIRDIATYSLNRVPSRYVTSAKGESHLQEEPYNHILVPVIRTAICVISREPHRFERTLTNHAANEIIDSIEGDMNSEHNSRPKG